ncbi:MAG TPA: Uma2 family endonuclease [Chloroflexi bacterium]|nr:Uma2 family endonuclease [Chloroflexota bacterium]
MPDAVLEQLLESPKLNVLFAQLQRIVSEEQARRQHFYATLHEGEKREFINGEVIVQSPVKLRHSLASYNLAMLLGAYVRRRKLGLVAHEKLLIALTRNDYEPDVCFFAADKAATFQPDQMIFPAPDFVAEVLSPSTEAIDRGVKFEDYAAHGITEYWIIDPDNERIEQYLLEGEAYTLAFKADSGVVRCRAVPGFVAPVRAVFDEAENLAALQRAVED